MKVRFLFAWYDLWVGAFWDRRDWKLYVLPLPMVGVVIEFSDAKRRHEMRRYIKDRVRAFELEHGKKLK